MEAEAFLPAQDKVVVLVVLRGRGKGSGVEIATPLAHVWTMRRGKVITGSDPYGLDTDDDVLGGED